MQNAVATNKRNTIFIMIFFLVFVGGVAAVFSFIYNSTGMLWIAMAIGAGYALFQYFAAAKIALRVNGAKEIHKQDNPRLWGIVEALALQNNMPMPKVYVVNDPAPNAFATGRDPAHAHVAATSGILDIMDDNELRAVMAHEMGHVKNYDIRVMMIVFGLVSAIGLIADMLMHAMWFRDEENGPSGPMVLVASIGLAILTPFIGMLVQAAVSRQREYLADATGATTTHDPEALATALEKLEASGTALRRQNASTAHLFFANPLSSKSFASAFSTHPPIADRAKRLRHMKVHL